MLDWFKVMLYHPNPGQLMNTVDFKRPANLRTGEIEGTYSTGTINSLVSLQEDAALKLTLYPSGKLFITGSLHKFWHGINHNDFGYFEVRTAISHICQTINVPPEICKITQIEYGINLRTSFDPDQFLKRLISFKYRPFESMRPRNGRNKEISVTDYRVKIYNKGKGRKYQLPYFLLRVERHVKGSRYLKGHDLKTFADIGPGTFERLAADLLSMLDEIIIDDKSISEKELTTQQRIALGKYRNPETWADYTRFSAPKALERFERLKMKYGKEAFIGESKKLMRSKFKELIEAVTFAKE